MGTVSLPLRNRGWCREKEREPTISMLILVVGTQAFVFLGGNPDNHLTGLQLGPFLSGIDTS